MTDKELDILRRAAGAIYMAADILADCISRGSATEEGMLSILKLIRSMADNSIKSVAEKEVK